MRQLLGAAATKRQIVRVYLKSELGSKSPIVPCRLQCQFFPPAEISYSHGDNEIPIWLEKDAIEALQIEHGIRLRPEGDYAHNVTGHIDFIQVRNGAVHILDYKPDARTNKPIAQLTLYALALTRLAGLRLFDIKCAWFNDEQYCEFFPRALLAR